MLRKRRILLADNDFELLDGLAKLLRDKGYEVLLARSPEEARHAFQAGGIDLAIIDKRLRTDDLSINDRSGVDVAATEGIGIPKILLTADEYMSYKEVDELVSKGELQVVFKHKGTPALLAALKRALVPTVFLAHGSNRLARAEVQLCLREWGLAVHILAEQHDAVYLLSGLEKAADECTAAIILMTADDMAGPIKAKEKKPRARQNVVFELGYFVGKLGSSQVIALIEDGIEKPSNYDGVKYVTFTPAHAEAWQQPLKAALRHAGVDVGLYAQ